MLTHQAVWLTFALWLDCTPPFDVDQRRRELGVRLLAEARAYPVASDLFFERLAMLGQLGYTGAIDPQWIDTLRAAQQSEGCFPVNDVTTCHPHPTGVALWTLGNVLAGP